VATNRRSLPVAAEVVWDVLADASAYAYWVVGSKAIRGADRNVYGSPSDCLP
jgi:hypothetical protein